MVRSARLSGLMHTGLVIVAVALLSAILLIDDGASPVAGQFAGRGGDGNPEAAEHLVGTGARLDALAQAKRNGTLGQNRPSGVAAPAGWTGQQPFDTIFDDWEPAIAADPSAPWVYAMVTRYGAPKPCPGNCPVPHIALEISSDGGSTWSASKPLCACKGEGQYDPIVEVVPDTGHVYALYMNGFNVMFLKSTDHGATWSAPVKTYGNVSWTDKPVLAVSDDGQDVYVSWNGPTGGDPYVAQSHNAGATWTQTKLADSDRYYFAFDAEVASDGTAYFSESSIRYSSAGQSGGIVSPVQHHVFVSRDEGASWDNVVVDSVEVGRPCVSAGCTPDFYIGHTVISADAGGNLTVLYDGATVRDGPQRIYARTSTDAGLSWSARTAISVDGENATTPAVEARGDGDVRAWYAQTNGGSDDAWNVWYRSSDDGGASWSAAVKLSDLGSGAAYKTPDGFLEVYGDYGEIDINSDGEAIAIWGEGMSWTGPGGVWFAKER